MQTPLHAQHGEDVRGLLGLPPRVRGQAELAGDVGAGADQDELGTGTTRGPAGALTVRYVSTPPNSSSALRSWSGGLRAGWPWLFDGLGARQQHGHLGDGVEHLVADLSGRRLGFSDDDCVAGRAGLVVEAGEVDVGQAE